METRERHRGRLIDHIGMVVRDMAASKAFYSAIFSELEIPIGGSDEHNFWADELFLATLDSEDVQGEPTGRHHLAFQAHDRAMVDAFYRAALAHDGRDNGPPGERSYHPGYYAAFVLDPDGNNIEAVFHGESERSAASVHIKYRIAGASAKTDNAAPHGTNAPPRMRTVLPRLIASDARGLVEFIVEVFGASGAFEVDRPSVVEIGDSQLLVGGVGPRTRTAAFLYVYAPDAAQVFRRALTRGAVPLEEPFPTPYGDFRCMFQDPWGNTWQAAQRPGAKSST